jgi:putative hydrolase of the HAD superfamily
MDKGMTMRPEIEAIFIDLGNTMRILVKDEQHQSIARQKISQLVGSDEPPELLLQRIDERYKVYRKWAFETLLEAHESELWTRWLLPDFPAEVISANAVELTYQYRQSMGKRVLQKDAREVVTELCRRGYQLGIISNVISSKEIPEWLEVDQFTPYFKSVILSSVCGKRKPDPEVYWEAARQIGVPPERCVYVGDNLARDVEGTRKAGFGMIIILMPPQELEKNPPTSENMPDCIIHEFSQLLEIFPLRLHAGLDLADDVP